MDFAIGHVELHRGSTLFFPSCMSRNSNESVEKAFTHWLCLSARVFVADVMDLSRRVPKYTLCLQPLWSY